MNDPIWDKVSELTKDYPPEFDAGAVHDLVLKAWRMGFDVVKAAAGNRLYQDALDAQCRAVSNVPYDPAGQANLANVKRS